MRLVIPFLLAAAFLVGPAVGQPSSPAGNLPLNPNNCGTPDEPKPCSGAKVVKAKTTASHKTTTTKTH